MPPITLLIKPSSGMCNMDCTYCFYHDIVEKREKESYGFMDYETLETVVKKTLDYSEGSCSFGFQGGEPTLIGLDFYKELIKMVGKYNKKQLKVYYFLQTNGYDLNKEWALFFKQHNFLIGLSIDGTVHTHNKYRKNSRKENTFEKVIATANLFQKLQVEFNILTVVNKTTAQSIRKIYNFYKKNKFEYLQFIPCMDPFMEEMGVEEYSLKPEYYGAFLCDLFDLWYEDKKKGGNLYIRQFENYIGMLLGHPPEACDMNGHCSMQYVVEADGGVYPCDFYVLESYLLGNFKTGNFIDFDQRRTELQFIEESLFIHHDCEQCKYYSLCRGGCKRYKVNEKTHFCKSYRSFFEHAAERMIDLARSF